MRDFTGEHPLLSPAIQPCLDKELIDAFEEKKTMVGLTDKEIELFKRFCQFEDEWKTFFADEFRGELHLSKGKNKPKIKFRWITEEEKELFSTAIIKLSTAP